ncbi:MAG: PQQ-binding-like beta-propeller repeat protein [Rhizobacter sp.]|nr:PQQ-binding-like beta-propeller repeat protein [Bacteriovorax sp.]
MVALLWPDQHQLFIVKDLHLAIIPTVLIPLTFLTVGLTSLAGMVAGWFGIKLHTEGPKQLLEVLLRKQVLISMILINVAGWALYRGVIYVNNLPSFIFTIDHYSKTNAMISKEIYTDSRFRAHDFKGTIVPAHKSFLKLLKEVKLAKGAFRSGVVSGNSIFYGVDDGNIYEIDKITLAVKRKFFIGKQVSTRPVIFQNKIYAGEGNHDTHHARIYSFDLTNGQFTGAFATNGHTEGQPVIGNFNNTNLMFITAGSDGLYALTPGLGKVWHEKDGHLDGTVSIENNFVYAGTGVEKGDIKDRSYASSYDFLTGKKIWKTELPLSNWMHPIVTQKDVCYVIGEIYTPSSVGQLYCLDKTSGSPHFAVPFESPVASKPFSIKTITDDLIFMGGLNGEVCGVSLSKKEKIWCKKTSLHNKADAFSSVDYDSEHGILIYPSYDNGIFAFSPEEGREIFHWTPSGKEKKWSDNSAAVTIDGDKIYHMDLDGNLRLFKLQLM